MMQLISLFKGRGWSITFACTAADSAYSVNLEDYGIDSVKVQINDSGFDRFIQQLGPTVVMFDRFMLEEQFGWRVAELCPRAVRILDTEDLHCLRKERGEALRKGPPFKFVKLLSSDIAKREVAAIFRCDLSLVISEVEMELLQQFFKINSALLHYVPFMLDSIEESLSERLAFNQRQDFVTIGNFRHPPNRDAVQYLRHELWPLIHKKLPETKLRVYGSYSTPQIEQLHKPENGFYIKGRAENAKTVVEKARVCLAPLRFGAGLKGKLVEAMQCGTPSVTTDIGAEGLNGALDWCGFIANEPEDIAAAAVELYCNEPVWKEAQKNGFRIINRRFLKKQFGEDLLKRITTIQQRLDDHRRQNFTGSMLMHHTAASSKYMSKWIEEKHRQNR